jgi:hypothetical protein
LYRIGPYRLEREQALELEHEVEQELELKPAENRPAQMVDRVGMWTETVESPFPWW